MKPRNPVRVYKRQKYSFTTRISLLLPKYQAPTAWALSRKELAAEPRDLTNTNLITSTALHQLHLRLTSLFLQISSLTTSNYSLPPTQISTSTKSSVSARFSCRRRNPALFAPHTYLPTQDGRLTNDSSLLRFDLPQNHHVQPSHPHQL